MVEGASVRVVEAETMGRQTRSSMANQLPTLILFKGGKEVARIPHVFKDGSFVRGRYRKKDIVTGFDLDGKGKLQRSGRKGSKKDSQKKNK